MGWKFPCAGTNVAGKFTTNCFCTATFFYAVYRRRNLGVPQPIWTACIGGAVHTEQNFFFPVKDGLSGRPPRTNTPAGN